MSDQWEDKLTAEQYHVLREKATEMPFSGEFLDHSDKGVYTCVACGTPLFGSGTKYESGMGWPSFWDAVDKSKLKLVPDERYGMRRTEVQCATCGGHLGHVFEDPRTPTGQDYCINSVCLAFKEQK